MPGQGDLITSAPFCSAGSDWPFSSTMSKLIPGIGRVALPGFSGVSSMPAVGAIMKPPVSVCHHVSIIGRRSLPITV